jgi:hypothetical protein
MPESAWRTCERCRTAKKRPPAAEKAASGLQSAVPGPALGGHHFVVCPPGLLDSLADMEITVEELAGQDAVPIPEQRQEVFPKASRRRLVIAIGDLHFPFHHRRCLRWILDLIEQRQPDAVVQMGDLFDMYAFSKYPRSLNVMTPKEELYQGRALAEEMWREIQRRAPKAECHQLHDDNHGARPVKRAAEFFASAEHIISNAVLELHKFPGVRTQADPRGDLELDGVVYQHGHLKLGAHARANQKHTVIGHLHRGAVTFDQDGRSWELCVGWAGAVEERVFSYIAKRRAHGSTLGVGVVDGYGPRFVPFEGR